MLALAWPLFLVLQEGPPRQETPVPSRVLACVVQVRGHLSGIRIQQGSGVVIAPGLVATNAHVVEGAQELSVRQGQTVWTVSTVRVDRSRDLCLLTVPGLRVPPAILAPDPKDPGQNVMSVGYPGGRGPVVSKGRLRGVWYLGEGRLLQSDTITLLGSSGGGLFDEEGRLLGLTTRTLATSPQMSFSVPVAWIRELAQRTESVDGRRPEWNLGDRTADLLKMLAGDPRNWPAWETAARQWVLDHPQDENAWLALGMSLDHKARTSTQVGQDLAPMALPDAVEAYRRSLTLRDDTKTWNNLGADLDLLNRFDEAERAFAAALALDPSYALAWLNLGCTRFNAGRYELAAAALKKGLTLRPDEADAWARLAHCQRRLGQGDAAAATLRIALRHRPLAAELWLDVGLLLVELGRMDEAKDIHVKLVPMNPELAARLQASLLRSQTLRSSRGGRKRQR